MTAKVRTYKHKSMATAKLIPYATNARTHSEQQVKQLAAAMREWGFTNPVLVDENASIIAGHGRVMAAGLLEMTHVPCIFLDGLSEAQKKAYRIADNKLALNSGWDEAMLATELEGLQADDVDLGLIGFDDAELANLFGDDEDEGDLDGENPGDDYKEAHALMVICSDADEQEQLYNRLIEMGLNVKAVSN